MFGTRHLKACFLAGSAVLLAMPAMAQSPDEEVVVTASKRAEKVREVSGSVNAVSEAQLKAIGAQSFQDYIQRVPGVVFNNYQPGVSHVVLRGIATSSGNVQGQGTTGYFVNDIPLAEPGFTIVIPDFDTFDVNRVEVLRGPQGTLFGSASLGGSVNTIVNVADPSGFDAAFEGTVSSTKNADASFAMKGMVNVPLDPTFAIRAVGNFRNEQGFLDNVGTGIDGANDVKVKGGRISAVWEPDSDTKVTLLSILQETDADDNSYQQPDIGDLKRSTSVPEFTDTEVEIHSLRVDHDLGFATLTAIGSYQEKSEDWRFDYTPIRRFYNADLDLNLTSPLYINSGGESDGKSIEVRLASPTGQDFEWLVGAMYIETDKYLYEQIGAFGAAAQFDQSSLFGPGSGAIIAPDGEIFNAFYSTVEGKESALFGEASYHFTPELKATVGGRLFRTEVETDTTQVGFSTYPGNPILSSSKTTDDGFSPKASITFSPNDDLMFYALASKGYRFGVPNVPGLSAYPIPSGSKSDKLWNYEIGARTSWLDRTLLIDITAFYVDWTDIQLRLQTPDFFNYATNGAAAKSQGIELSAAWRPIDGLSLSTAVTFMEAELTEPLEVLFYGTAPEGSPLPGSSKWTITNTASYTFDGEYGPTVSLTHTYLSRGLSDLNSAVPGAIPNEQGDYNVFDARIATTLDKTTFSFFATNFTDERGVTRTVSEANGLGQGLVRPRTFGVTVGWSY